MTSSHDMPPPPVPSPADEDFGLVDALAQLSFVVQSALAEIAGQYDLSVIQTRMLGILRDREPTMNQLGRHLGLDKSSITGLVDRAQRRGLVTRTASAVDRRSFQVSITDAGRAARRAGRRSVRRADREACRAAARNRPEATVTDGDPDRDRGRPGPWHRPAHRTPLTAPH